MNSGFLLILEGIDGSGKSTLANNLAHLLHQEGLSVVQTREPGKTELGIKLRSLLQEGSVALCQKAEYLLFAANRAQNFHEVIMPALQAQQCVISDRLSDSSLVYQGFARGLDSAMLKTINSWSMSGYTPDLVIYVRTSVDVAAQRLKNRSGGLSRFETDPSFVQRVYEGYEQLVAPRPDVMVVDGNLEPDVLAQMTCNKVMQHMHNQGILTS